MFFLFFFKVDLKIEGFLAQPTLDKFHKCTKEHLIAIADHFEIPVSGQSQKKLIKTELWSAFSLKGVLPCEQVALKSHAAKQSVDERVRA